MTSRLLVVNRQPYYCKVNISYRIGDLEGKEVGHSSVFFVTRQYKDALNNAISNAVFKISYYNNIDVEYDPDEQGSSRVKLLVDETPELYLDKYEFIRLKNYGSGRFSYTEREINYKRVYFVKGEPKTSRIKYTQGYLKINDLPKRRINKEERLIVDRRKVKDTDFNIETNTNLKLSKRNSGK